MAGTSEAGRTVARAEYFTAGDEAGPSGSGNPGSSGSFSPHRNFKSRWRSFLRSTRRTRRVYLKWPKIRIFRKQKLYHRHGKGQKFQKLLAFIQPKADRKVKGIQTNDPKTSMQQLPALQVDRKMKGIQLGDPETSTKQEFPVDTKTKKIQRKDDPETLTQQLLLPVDRKMKGVLTDDPETLMQQLPVDIKMKGIQTDDPGTLMQQLPVANPLHGLDRPNLKPEPISNLIKLMSIDMDSALKKLQKETRAKLKFRFEECAGQLLLGTAAFTYNVPQGPQF